MMWISVKDRLPESNGMCVLVWTGAAWLLARHIGEGVWYEGWARDCPLKVTHWLPLPAPPKEG